VELAEVVRRRRMVRRYSAEPVPEELLDRVLSVAVQAPSAGFSQGVDLLVLEGPTQTRRFFEATSDPEFLAEPGAMRGLLEAPVIVLPLGDPNIYVARYSALDKVGSSLAGLPAEDWPVPYWLVDSSFTVMLLLLAATDAGLGALFFRLHRDPGPLLATLGVPEGKQVIGAVALGYEATSSQQPSGASGDASVALSGTRPSGSPGRRVRRRMGEIVHLERW